MCYHQRLLTESLSSGRYFSLPLLPSLLRFITVRTVCFQQFFLLYVFFESSCKIVGTCTHTHTFTADNGSAGGARLFGSVEVPTYIIAPSPSVQLPVLQFSSSSSPSSQCSSPLILTHTNFFCGTVRGFANELSFTFSPLFLLFVSFLL